MAWTDPYGCEARWETVKIAPVTWASVCPPCRLSAVSSSEENVVRVMREKHNRRKRRAS